MAGAFERLRNTLPFGRKKVAEVKREDDRWDLEKVHDAAVREVQALLAKPDNLGRLGKLQADYETQRASVQMQISLLTGRQAAEARSGIDMLARCRENVKQIKDLKAKLEHSINASESNLPQYANLRKVYVVHRNLSRTIVDLDAIAVMPMELARIEEELKRLDQHNCADEEDSDEGSRGSGGSESGSDYDSNSGSGSEKSGASGTSSQRAEKKRQKRKAARAQKKRAANNAAKALEVDNSLPRIHKDLLKLERCQQAALYAAQNNAPKHAALKEQLDQLDLMFDRVAARVTKIVQNCVIEAEIRPAILVKMLQMVERQEQADGIVRDVLVGRRRGSTQAIDMTTAKQRYWTGKVMTTLSEYIDTKFSMMCASIIEIQPIDVPMLIAEHEKIVDEIFKVNDLVAPCFPPAYRIFEFFVESYHRLLVGLVKNLMELHVSSLSPADIIAIVNWLRDYHAQMEGLDTAKVTPVLTDDLGALLQGYNYQIEQMMRGWSSRMIEDEMRDPPESTSEGKLYTVAPIDLFKMIDQQFEVVDTVALEDFTFKFAMIVSEMLDDYRIKKQDILIKGWKAISIDHIIAQANNSARCVECCLQLLDELTEKLPDSRVENIELQRVADGFTEFSKVASELLGRIIFEDLHKVLGMLFTWSWYSGENLVADCISNTVCDYAEEFRNGLHDTCHRKTLVYILDHLVILILARLLNDKGQCLPIEAEFVAALEEDVEKLSETIQELGLPKRMLAPRVKPLDHFMKLCKILAEYPKSGQGDAAGASNEKAKQTEEEEEEEKEGKGKGKGERVNIAKKSGAASKAGAGAAPAATAEFSLDDLEVGNVLGNMFGKASSAPAAAAAGIQGEIVAWYTLALKDMADLPCDSIARLLRRREAIASDKRLRVSILKECADVAAAFLAEKGVDLLKGPEAGVMTAVYKELGVKPLAGAAVESMATSLFHDMSAAFSKRKPSDNATAARRRVLQNLRRKAPAVHSAAAYGDGEEEDEAANTIDILWKLDD